MGEKECQCCVVCGKSIAPGAERYGNAWEASLKQHPCCDHECSQTFDSSIHWLPGRVPAEISEEEADLYIRGVERRLSEGEKPGLVARDLLCAGVPVWQARSTLVGVAAKAQRSDRLFAGANRPGWLQGVVTGTFTLFGDTKRGKADVHELLDAEVELKQWLARFGED